MRKEVTIQQADGERITAGCDRSACEGCKGSFFCTSKKASFEVLNPEKIDLSVGDTAEIDMPSSKTLFSVFMSLGLPLLMFLPGYFITAILTESEGLRFLGAIAGVAVGFGIAAIYFHVKKKEYMPRVIRKVR